MPRSCALKTILLTGGNGFICSNLAQILSRDPTNRVVLQLRPNDTLKTVPGTSHAYLRVDLMSRDQTLRALEGVHSVVHLAYDHRSARSNVEGTKCLIEASLAVGVRRFVHLSSMAVYEPLPDGVMNEDYTPGAPSSQYAAIKRDQEAMLLSAFRDAALPVLILQPTIVYGPGRNVWTTVPAEQLLCGDLYLPEMGLGKAAVVHVQDLCSAIVRALEVDDPPFGQKFLISGPDLITWGEYYGFLDSELRTFSLHLVSSSDLERISVRLSVRVREHLRRPVKLLRFGVFPRYPLLGTIDRLLPRAANVPRGQYRALLSAKGSISIRKAERELGFQPRIPFNEGKLTLIEHLRLTYAAQRSWRSGKL